MKIHKLFLITFILAGCFGKDPVAEKTGMEGNPLPDFNLLLGDSTTYFNTHNIPKNKPFAIFYFSPVCPFCRAQTTEIIEDMHKLRNIQFYFVTSFPVFEMKNYIKEYKLSEYPNVLVGKDIANFVANYFNAYRVPYMALYGKDKKLRKTYRGKIYSSQIKKGAEQ